MLTPLGSSTQRPGEGIAIDEDFVREGKSDPELFYRSALVCSSMDASWTGDRDRARVVWLLQDAVLPDGRAGEAGRVYVIE